VSSEELNVRICLVFIMLVMLLLGQI